MQLLWVSQFLCETAMSFTLLKSNSCFFLCVWLNSILFFVLVLLLKFRASIICSLPVTWEIRVWFYFQLFDQGIYETKVSLEFNAIVQIGCVCKVDKTAKKRNIQDCWNLKDLQMKTTTECSYLEQSLSFFYLYHR